MATAKQYEEKIRSKWYGNKSLAQAAVTRADLPEATKRRLYALIVEMWAEPAPTTQPTNGNGHKPGPTHIGLAELPELDRLAMKVALFAAKNNITVADLTVQLIERIDKL